MHSFSEKTENQQEYTSWHAKSAPKFQQKNALRCTHLYVLTTYLSHWSIKIGKIINVDPWIDSFRALQSTTNKVRSCWACARLITGDELRVTRTPMRSFHLSWRPKRWPLKKRWTCLRLFLSVLAWSGHWFEEFTCFCSPKCKFER